MRTIQPSELTCSVRPDARDRQELVDRRWQLATKVLDDVLRTRVQHAGAAVIPEASPERVDVLIA